MKKFLLFLTVAVLLTAPAFSQKTKRSKAANASPVSIEGHPAWIMQGNIYEVNVRQYTQEGTFNAFAKHLDRLKKMGVQTLWFMPINPISKKDRKGTLGSYYAVADYTAVNPEFGNLDDWKKLVALAHSKDMKVIIDWVPNHTGNDHAWLTNHVDFYRKDSTGKPAMAFDWADTKQLEYPNVELQDSMIASMKYWLNNTNIDGFRCDVAGEVPDYFWKKCIASLHKIKNVFMLAEGDKPQLNEDGFDATYGWDMFAMMKKVAKGDRPAFALDSMRRLVDNTFPKNSLRMLFTSNHDENTWNKADFETMPGAVHAPFAVFTQTMARGVPLIYSGQEEPVLKAIEFFEKDPMTFNELKREKFYNTLLHLHTRNAALAPSASFKKIITGDTAAVYSFVREKAGKKVLVILNLSGTEQKLAVKDKTLWGMPYNVFMGTKEKLSGKEWSIEPWGYVVYEY